MSTLRRFVLTGVLCVVAAAPLDAQTNPSDTLSYEVDEMVITGTRTYRKIIDVPYSVERIDNTQFTYDRKVAVDNVLGGIPGLFLQSRYGNHDVRISIRGFGSRSNTGIRGVRILLDGIPESEPDGQTRIEAIDFQSVGSIEVVKGNASSLYTNAPGGVINFINDVAFPRSMVMSFNEFGSHGVRENGIKTGVRTDAYTFLLTYKYHQAEGFRPHSQDYWNIVNTVLETRPGGRSRLSLFGYFADGLIRLPGSLTAAQFAADPFQANRRDVARDARRYTRKGRLGVQFLSAFGGENQHEVEFTGYGTMKFFDRLARTYRIFNRNGVGASGRVVTRGTLFGLGNEFSVGGDVFYQTGPIEEYDNIGGTKGDNLLALTNEGIGNAGVYLQNSLSLLDNLDLLLTGRYDNVVFSATDRLLGVRDTSRSFSRFTPKVAVNYKLSPTVALYGSAGLGFDTPASNELDNYPTSTAPTVLLNPDLMPQKSTNLELGVKGNLFFPDVDLFRLVYFDAAVFHSIIRDEIVPFEVFGDVYYRNAAETRRTGLELGGSTEILRRLTLRLAYTWSRFTYRSYDAQSVDIDTAGTTVSISRDFSGNIVPSVPGDNIVAGLSYEHPLTEAVTGFVKATWQYVGGMYANDANAERTGVYQLVGASIGADARAGGFNVLVSAGVQNVFDKRYAAFVNINSASGEFYEAGEPRTFYGGINLGYQF